MSIKEKLKEYIDKTNLWVSIPTAIFTLLVAILTTVYVSIQVYEFFSRPASKIYATMEELPYVSASNLKAHLDKSIILSTQI